MYLLIHEWMSVFYTRVSVFVLYTSESVSYTRVSVCVLYTSECLSYTRVSVCVLNTSECLCLIQSHTMDMYIQFQEENCHSSYSLRQAVIEIFWNIFTVLEFWAWYLFCGLFFLTVGCLFMHRMATKCPAIFLLNKVSWTPCINNENLTSNLNFHLFKSSL